ncbi:unnamed protein product [Ectocarpus sp. 4 AP-2014]
MSCSRRTLLLWTSSHRRATAAVLVRSVVAAGRCSSTTAAAATPTAPPADKNAAAAAAPNAGGKEGVPEAAAAAKKRLDENESIFSKHGGKMVLGFIGALGLWFLRSHLGGKALDAVKDQVEEACPLEPVEVEELRCSNDFPPDVFDKVLDSVRRAFPSGRATYPEFARHITSSGLLPEPLSMGFLLDRMVLTAAAHPGILGAAARGETPHSGGSSGEGGGGGWASISADAVELEVDFLMVAFSAAVNTRPAERTRQLWDVAQGRSMGAADGGRDQDTDEAALLPASKAISLVGMLMASHQLPSGRYAVKDESRVWPVQQYRLASGRDAFLDGLLSLHEDEEKRTKGWIERKLAPAYDPAKEEQISFELFERVLRSGPVCAWGECLGIRNRDKL